MFDPTSRYYSLDQATYVVAGGQTVTYVRRRFLPPGKNMPLLVEVTVVQGDRLDLIAFRTLGDPEQFWRICDANNAMDPLELMAQPGTKLRVPIPQF
jgi:nucleoid-associated protein YgaU